MGIFQTFVSDPSDGWPSQRQMPLVLDLRDLALNGVRLGEDAHRLIAFGRPSNKQAFKAGRFVWCDVGLLAEIEDGRIAYFAVALAADPIEAIGPVRLEIITAGGAHFIVAADTPSSALVERLGEPVGADRDEDETVLYYAIVGARLEIECSPQGNLRRVNWFAE